MSPLSHDSDQAQAHSEYTAAPHKSKLSHELIAGAVSYMAVKAYKSHVAKNGQPASHAQAEELLAGFTGAFIDREAETHGLDWLDKEKAKRDANHKAQSAIQT
ncbi:putative phosphoglycerate mutase family protein [Auriscalpium vulgare]|uniref:Phosphoglycerate mutase family protein n=1 Tax=Auriscalpium vulgare TaxID=40419 RepID=A0ACB8R6Q9_9AGAM|nr:putative phosphoglycerate mutase family protein [Auriscalpium vulgare]